MSTRFQRHDTLRLFLEISRFSTLSAAADSLNMTKGALSYQIKVLEDALEMQLFHRKAKGVALTKQGTALVETCQPHFEALEQGLNDLIKADDMELTVGLSSYFAARWLSPRLMSFMERYPCIRLRLQPMTSLFDLENQGVDIAIRWGSGRWDDAKVEPFLQMPAWPVGNQEALLKVEDAGLETAMSTFTLLRDHDDSNAWAEWKQAANLPSVLRRETLIIPDPNVRVEAVVDGQGIALMDALVSNELNEGRMVRLSECELADYGYFLVEPFANQGGVAVGQFSQWIKDEARQ